MAVVHSVASPSAHLAQSSDPLSVTSFLAFSCANTAADRTTSEHTKRDAIVFIVGTPKKGALFGLTPAFFYPPGRWTKQAGGSGDCNETRRFGNERPNMPFQ